MAVRVQVCLVITSHYRQVGKQLPHMAKSLNSQHPSQRDKTKPYVKPCHVQPHLEWYLSPLFTPDEKALPSRRSAAPTRIRRRHLRDLQIPYVHPPGLTRTLPTLGETQVKPIAMTCISGCSAHRTRSSPVAKWALNPFSATASKETLNFEAQHACVFFLQHTVFSTYLRAPTLRTCQYALRPFFRPFPSHSALLRSLDACFSQQGFGTYTLALRAVINCLRPCRQFAAGR
jgi:hypothetical protein